MLAGASVQGQVNQTPQRMGCTIHPFQVGLWFGLQVSWELTWEMEASRVA